MTARSTAEGKVFTVGKREREQPEVSGREKVADTHTHTDIERTV